MASPDTDKLMAMSDLYGMSVDELLTGASVSAAPGEDGARTVECRDEQLEFLQKSFPILCTAAFLLYCIQKYSRLFVENRLRKR